jgi:hypothetical protein
MFQRSNLRSMGTTVAKSFNCPREPYLETTQVRLLRIYCGSNYSTVTHRKALLATDALANRLMQLRFRNAAHAEFFPRERAVPSERATAGRFWHGPRHLKDW